MKPALRARPMHKREPGLLGLPGLGSIPILGPILSPSSSSNGGSNPAPSPAPPSNPLPAPLPSILPLPAPAPSPVAPPASSPPHSSNPSPPPPTNGGGNGQGSPNPGNSGSTPGSSQLAPSPSSGSSTPASIANPAQPAKPVNPANPANPSHPASSSVAGGSFGVNNGAAQPGSNNGTTGGSPKSASSTIHGGGTVGDTSFTLGGAVASNAAVPSGSSSVSGNTNVATTGGNTSWSGTNPSTPIVANAPVAAAKSSHLSGAVIGGIVGSLVLVSIILCLIFLRKRYQRIQAERRVTWIGGVTGSPDMDQRASVRSSWGTPVETGSWDRMSYSDFSPNTQPTTFAPVLPMPVYPSTNLRPGGSEDPFADSPTAAQPNQSMISLPIRLSLISTGSLDPFDDMYQCKAQAAQPTVQPSIPVGGIYTGLNNNNNTPSSSNKQANFPLPPDTPTSAQTIYAISDPADLPRPRSYLQTPAISITFPDSPVSPTFAAHGTSSYPRRASVKQNFQRSVERHDEVSLQRGDAVSVVSVYEDGWAFVQKEKNQERGLVPLNHLEIDNNNRL